MSSQKDRLTQQMMNKRPQQQADALGPRSVAEAFQTPDSPFNAHINIRTTSEFRDEVKMYCAKYRISLQEVVNKALEEYMERHKKSATS